MDYIQEAQRYYYEDVLPGADPRTQDWLLLNRSPVYVICLTVAYLLFVWLGPKYMRNKPAFSLQGVMVVYNIALVGLSVYMLVEILLSAFAAGYGFLCAPYNEETRQRPKEMRVARVLWWYFFSKAIELNDTVLMVLRKKMSQVTFLHVFHHASMLNIWWWVMMFIPGGLSYFGSALNCLVHVVMYLYYGLSVIPSLRGKLWWKRYITLFQLIQFCITLSHTLYTLYSPCDFPAWGQHLLAGYMIFMLVLFTNFYIHAYIMKRAGGGAGRSAVEPGRGGAPQATAVRGDKGGETNVGGRNEASRSNGAVRKIAEANGSAEQHKNGGVQNGGAPPSNGYVVGAAGRAEDKKRH